MSIYTDTQLMELIRDSDQEAFNQLYDRYWRLLFGLAVQKTGGHAEAEDIVQELFIDLWNRRKKISINHSVRTWLVAAAYNRIFRHFRDKGIREKHQEDFARFLGGYLTDPQASVFPDAADFETEFGKLQDIIEEEIRQMPAQMQRVTLLRYREQKSVAEIASELQLSPLTVKTHLKLAMQRLRQNTGEYPANTMALLVFLWISQSLH